eukprot:s2232_g20.t1
MDAILDIAYTSTYLIITLLAIYELQLDQTISGNFGDEASVNFQAELDPAFAFPSDFLGFFAVYYSLAHVCTVCRALERSDRLTYRKRRPSLPSSASQSLLSPSGFSCSKRFRICGKALYSPCLLVTIVALLLSTHFYPIHRTDFRCFPCRCGQKDNRTKHLASCSLVGVLRLKDVSLSEQNITSVAEDAFTSSRGLQRLSLSGNRLPFLPGKLFAPLDSLQLLDLGRLGLQHVESDTFLGLSNLRILSLSQNHLKELPEDLLRPMPALEQLLLGGKFKGGGLAARVADGNELKALPQELLHHSPRIQVFDVSENKLKSLPKGIFAKVPLLQTLDLGSNKLTELPGKVFSGLGNLLELDLSSNRLGNLQDLNLDFNSLGDLPVEVWGNLFGGLGKLQTLSLGYSGISLLHADSFSGLGNLQGLYLGGNSLGDLPVEVWANLFAPLGKLRTLDLSHQNNLNDLPAEAWTDMCTGLQKNCLGLRSLWLNHNNLNELPAEVWANVSNMFSGFSKLEVLTLYDNGLSELPAICSTIWCE